MQSHAEGPAWDALDAVDESCQTHCKVYAKWPVAQSGEARWRLLLCRIERAGASVEKG